MDKTLDCSSARENDHPLSYVIAIGSVVGDVTGGTAVAASPARDDSHGRTDSVLRKPPLAHPPV